MLSSKKKGLFYEVSEFSRLCAVCSGFEPPLQVLDFKEFAVTDTTALGEYLQSLNPGGRSRKMMPAQCIVYPDTRFIRKTPIDNKKLKDDDYLVQLVKSDLGIDPEKNLIRLLNPSTGKNFDLEKPGNSKHILVCGAEMEELNRIQNEVVEMGLFPKSIELGSLLMIGGLIDYLKWQQIPSPILSVEIQGEYSQVYIVTAKGVEICKTIPHGVNSMIPILQNELGLADKESAMTLLFSKTLDFEDLGPRLIRKMLHELQASTGFYEVQTGVSVGLCHVSLVPEGFDWMVDALADSLGVQPLDIDAHSWGDAHEISLSGVASEQAAELDLFRFYSTVSSYKTELPHESIEED